MTPALSLTDPSCEALRNDEPAASGISLRWEAFETPQIIEPIITTEPRTRRHRLALGSWRDPACILRAVDGGALKLEAGEAGTRLLNAGESQIVARALAGFSRVERVGSDISIPSVSNELDLSEP